jgi:hypothetical protein
LGKSDLYLSTVDAGKIPKGYISMAAFGTIFRITAGFQNHCKSQGQVRETETSSLTVASVGFLELVGVL